MKNNFIELTRNGENILLNISFISSISKSNSKTILHIRPINQPSQLSLPNDPNSITVDENYETVKSLIFG
jgi:hypothetical protein